jgi:hypothetical protein
MAGLSLAEEKLPAAGFSPGFCVMERLCGFVASFMCARNPLTSGSSLTWWEE